ncbi:MAG: hypothetical protein IJT91_09075 [Clostridia bacterium]|nr:hypothetical protein [Clostridia bacterium]
MKKNKKVQCNERVQCILKELHLYNSKQEYFIKFLIWTISWIGGIYVIKDESLGVGSAFFIFSITLLMEFSSRINGKKERIVQVIYTLLCFAMGAMLFLSAIILFSAEYIKVCHRIMYVISLIILIYMFVDCFVLWISNEVHPISDNNTNDKIDDNIDENDERVEVFNSTLVKGNLGDIK